MVVTTSPSRVSKQYRKVGCNYQLVVKSLKDENNNCDKEGHTLRKVQCT